MVHSRENLKEKGLWVGLEGLESSREVREEVDDFLCRVCSGGRIRADAVAWRACSRGVEALCCAEGGLFEPCPGPSGLLNGIIFPSKLHLLFELAGGSAATLKSVELE